MSFTALKEKILAEASAKLEVQRREFSQEFVDEETRIKKQARLVEEDVIAQAQVKAQQEAKRLRQAAQLKARADILRAKQEQLDVVLEDTVKQVLDWDEDATQNLLEALFEFIPDAKGSIMPGSLHEAKVREIARKRKISVSDDAIPDEGGFVYQGEDAELNLTIHHLVKQVFARNRAAIAQTLF